MAASNQSRPVFIADSCVGGLSVLKSLWGSGIASNAVFLADYAINPLGVKTDEAIAEVVERWLERAAMVSDRLVIACNTLSIRHHQLHRSEGPGPVPGLVQVVSMVDCFKAMVNAETDRLTDRKVLIVGTEFTASQGLYAEILNDECPGIRVDTVAATELERKIARFEPRDGAGDASFTAGLRQALENADVAVLACTCFPMVRAELESLYPDVILLDPGSYCSGLLRKDTETQGRNLSIEITGKVVSDARVIEHAKSYLEEVSIDLLGSQ